MTQGKAFDFVDKYDKDPDNQPLCYIFPPITEVDCQPKGPINISSRY